jgi:hypothetical protein
MEIDRSQSTQITYKGFEAGHKSSGVSDQMRL